MQGRLFVILAAHLQNQDVERNLLLHQQYRNFTAFNISARVTVIGNEPPGRNDDELSNMVRRIDGLDYRRNADWPTYGWEMGAYRAGLASLKGVAAPEDTVLFAQDSFVLVNAERFAKSLEAWAAAGARSACLLTFDKKIALSAGIVERLKQWVGPSYDQGSNWKGCTFNSFIMSWRDLPKLEKSGLFAPATPDRTDSLALERYFATSSPTRPRTTSSAGAGGGAAVWEKSTFTGTTTRRFRGRGARWRSSALAPQGRSPWAFEVALRARRELRVPCPLNRTMLGVPMGCSMSLGLPGALLLPLGGGGAGGTRGGAATQSPVRVAEVVGRPLGLDFEIPVHRAARPRVAPNARRAARATPRK